MRCIQVVKYIFPNFLMLNFDVLYKEDTFILSTGEKYE